MLGRLEQEPPKEQDAEDDQNRDDDDFDETHVAPRRSEVLRILKMTLLRVNPNIVKNCEVIGEVTRSIL